MEKNYCVHIFLEYDCINEIGEEMAINFVSTRNRQGRPKKECPIITSQLQSKRCAIGGGANQLTGLHLLYARKQLSSSQFAAGSYYCELSQRLRRSMGGIAGTMASTITKIDHLPGTHSGMVMNQSALCTQNGINEILGYVHKEALSLVQKILLGECLETAQIVKEISFTELGIFRKALDVIYNYLQQNAVSLEQYEKSA